MSECWLDVDIDIDDTLIKDKYLYKCFPRKTCKGGGLTLLYKKELHEFLSIEKVQHESILWVKFHKDISVENTDLYIGFIYIPHENNVFYKKNEDDLFNVLNEDVSMYKEKGCVIISGDFNSRIGNSPDFIEYDVLNTELNDILSSLIEYDFDSPMSERKSQDLIVNSFGRKLLDLCRSTSIRICNGRISGDEDGKFTFFNHRGASTNDFTIVSENYFHVIDYFDSC